MVLLNVTVAYLLSYLAANSGFYLLSGLILMINAAGVSIYDFHKSGRLTCPAVLFSLSWIGGSGISCLKLSNLQVPWETETWLVIYLTYAVFRIVYELSSRYFAKIRGANAAAQESAALQEAAKTQSEIQVSGGNIVTPGKKASAILTAMCVITVVSVCSFVIEAVCMGYIPLFIMDTPHAYSYFHVSGLHYFTVSFVLLPAMGVLYLDAAGALCSEGFSALSRGAGNKLWKELWKPEAGNISRKDWLLLSVCISAGIVLPVLLVSRYQLLFGLMLAGTVYLILAGGRIRISFSRRNLMLGVTAFLALLALYLFITVRRAHSIDYLNGIFEMKNAETPIFVTQPYIYIANNFDNLNCLVRDLPAHTHGLRMLFPWIALFGLKFTHPELAAFPIYVTKEELTTVTLVYDAYYDFGIAGVILFVAAGTLLAAYFERMALRYVSSRGEGRSTGKLAAGNASGESAGNASSSALRFFFVMIYGQILIYLALAFFTTWLSNPTTWFLFGLTTLLSVVIWLLSRRKERVE